MFATNGGTVRRNKLSDFIEVRQNGKIAMKLDEGDRIVGVEVCSERHDVLLTTAEGQAIRFPVTDVRVFKGRESAGVRGIKLEGEDQTHLHGDPVACRGVAGRARRLCAPGQSASRRGGADHEQDVESEGNGQEVVLLTGALRRA